MDLEEENRQKLGKSKSSLLNCIQLLSSSIQKLTNFSKEKEVGEALDSVKSANEEISQICFIIEGLESLKRDEIEKRSQKNHEINTLKLELRKQNEILKALEEENQNLLTEAENDRLKLKEFLEVNEDLNNKLKNSENGVKEKLQKFEEEKIEAENNSKSLEIKLKAAEKKNKWLWKTIDKFKDEKKQLKTKVKDLELAQSQFVFSPTKSEISEENIPQSQIFENSLIDNGETEEKLKKSLSEIEELNKKINSLKSNYNKVSKESQEKEGEILKLKKTIEELEASDLSNKLKIEELVEKLENKNQTISELRREIEKEKGNYSELQLNYTEMEQTLKHAKAEATKHLLMPRVSVLKRTNSGYMDRKSALPDQEVEQNPSDDYRGRSHTVQIDLNPHEKSKFSAELRKEEIKENNDGIDQEKKMKELEEERMRQEFGLKEEIQDPRENVLNIRNSVRESVGFVNSK